RVSQVHPLSSSPGMRDVTAAMSAGAALLPWDSRRAGPRALAAWIEREGVTVLGSAVSTLRPLLAEPDIARPLRSVRVVHLGSEPLYRQDVERFRERFAPWCLLVLGYGSTEAVPVTELHIRHDTPLPAGRVPAGHVVGGAEVLVLDEAGAPVDAGQAGEVAVRSRFLADGYWRRPDLTSEKFRPDPTDPTRRIYRTGDVGRLGPDGCLEILGRTDAQVKVRGHRIHPGQVESALTEHEAIRQAVVKAVTARGGEARRDRLHHRLPDRLVLGQRRLHLSRVDSMAPHLDLGVGATEDLEAAVGAEPTHVAGPVDPPRGIRRIRPELLARQVRATPVAVGQEAAAHRDLTRLPGVDRRAGLVEHEHLGASDHVPGGDTARRQRGVVADVELGDRNRLGRSVAEHQQTPRREALAEALHVLPVERLAAEMYHPYRPQRPRDVRLGEQGPQRAHRGPEHGHSFALDPGRER